MKYFIAKLQFKFMNMILCLAHLVGCGLVVTESISLDMKVYTTIQSPGYSKNRNIEETFSLKKHFISVLKAVVLLRFFFTRRCERTQLSTHAVFRCANTELISPLRLLCN